MKKLLLASAIAALSVSAANAAPTVYGKVFMTADYVDAELDPALTTAAKIDDNGVQINSNGSRIGFKGSEPLSANTDVVYKLEYGIDVDADDNKSFKNRDTYLGIKNNTFGELRVGNIQSTTDYINNVVVTEGFWDNLGTTKLEDEKKLEALNMADSGRISNSIVWIAPKYNEMPIELAVMYGNDDNISGSNDSGWGASLMFDQGTGFTAGVAYEEDLNIRDSMKVKVNNKDVDTFIGGKIIRGTATVDLGKMNAGLPVTLGALYQEADYDMPNSEKEKGYVVSASMGLKNFSKPAEVYAQYNNTSDLGGVNGYDSDQMVVGGKYFYQKNMIVHGYVGQNKADHNNDDAKVFAVGGGLEYKF